MKRTTKLGVESFANRYLDRVIDRLKLPSDYACAKALDLTPQAVWKIRAGGAMSATTAAKIAQILEIEPFKVIAEIELERSADDVWKWVAKRVAAGVLVAVGAGITPPPAIAAPHSVQASQPLCIMSNRRRRAWWIAFLPFGIDPLDELPDIA